MKVFTEKEIVEKFEKLNAVKQNVVLKKALKLAVNGRAGTYEYAIATSMGYNYEDDGSYSK